jgi:hypothetical protein
MGVWSAKIQSWRRSNSAVRLQALEELDILRIEGCGALPPPALGGGDIGSQGLGMDLRPDAPVDVHPIESG